MLRRTHVDLIVVFLLRAAMFGAPLSIATASNLDSEVVFHISAQPLDSALLEFSKQANTPVAFAAASIGNLRTRGVDGKLAARTALEVLLCNSGLKFTQIGDTVTVVPLGAQSIASSCENHGSAQR
jgi:hypothetical protein